MIALRTQAFLSMGFTGWAEGSRIGVAPDSGQAGLQPYRAPGMPSTSVTRACIAATAVAKPAGSGEGLPCPQSHGCLCAGNLPITAGYAATTFSRARGTAAQ